MEKGVIYYHFKCGCISTDYNLTYGKKDCPNCDTLERVVLRAFCCVECGKYCELKPSGGRVNLRCAYHKNKARNLTAKLKKDALPVVIEPEPISDFKNPKAALTLSQANLRGVHCIQSANLFLFHREMLKACYPGLQLRTIT